MLTRILQVALISAIAATVGWAQETPAESGKEAAAPAENAPASSGGVVDLRKAARDKIKVLAPKDVPGELKRLKSKADIKAEITVNVTGAQPVTFKGVIRNGKLIEKLDKTAKRFLVEKEFTDQHCGVRLWWSGNSDGFIFFRYSTIKTLTLTGQLSAEERAEIMRRLKAKREGLDPDKAKKAAAQAEAKRFAEIEAMSPKDRAAYLLSQYAGKGWNGKRYRELRRKKLVDDVELSPNEEIFVKYYRVLEQVRFHALRDAAAKKEKFEPGSAESDDSEEPSSGKPEEE